MQNTNSIKCTKSEIKFLESFIELNEYQKSFICDGMAISKERRAGKTYAMYMVLMIDAIRAKNLVVHGSQILELDYDFSHISIRTFIERFNQFSNKVFNHLFNARLIAKNTIIISVDIPRFSEKFPELML